MKALITSTVALLIGLAVGAFIGHRSYDRRVTNEAVQQLVESGESSDRERAARAVRAIEMIQAGTHSDAPSRSEPIVSLADDTHSAGVPFINGSNSFTSSFDGYGGLRPAADSSPR